MKCSWKRCRQTGDHISVADRKLGTYHLCLTHWLKISKTSGSIQEQLTTVAIPSKPNTK